VTGPTCSAKNCLAVLFYTLAGVEIPDGRAIITPRVLNEGRTTIATCRKSKITTCSAMPHIPGSSCGYFDEQGLRATRNCRGDGSLWFNLWRNKLWPYDELRPGDDLFWYETPTQRIVWKTRVTQVEAFAYASLDDALDRIGSEFYGEIDRAQPYIDGKPDEGFCLAYSVTVVERLDLRKPSDLRFNQQGWERGDRPEIAAWLSGFASAGVAGGNARNPDWTRDEIVLAYDLFLRAGCIGGNPLPHSTNPEVVSLSEQMARLPIHPAHRRRQDFRNPTSVALKLANGRRFWRYHSYSNSGDEVCSCLSTGLVNVVPRLHRCRYSASSFSTQFNTGIGVTRHAYSATSNVPSGDSISVPSRSNDSTHSATAATGTPMIASSLGIVNLGNPPHWVQQPVGHLLGDQQRGHLRDRRLLSISERRRGEACPVRHQRVILDHCRPRPT